VLKHNRRFDIIYKEFESDKFCYLSFISFLIKPLQRLLHYEYLFESKKIFGMKFLIVCFFSMVELLHFYKNNNYDNEYQDCYGVFIKIQDLIENFAESLTILVGGVFH
jgi:hypothetical protein